MQGLAFILAASFLVEALVEYGKDIKDNPAQIASVAVGILVAILFNATLFNTLLEVPVNQYADIALTGVLISRGSNWLSDFLGGFNNLSH